MVIIELLLMSAMYGRNSLDRHDPGLTRLRVEIHYDLPGRGFARFLRWHFRQSYAKWCTRQMVIDAQRAFV